MKNTTFKAIAIFLAIFGTSWLIKLTVLDSPKEVSYTVIDSNKGAVEGQINSSERILSAADSIDKEIAQSNDSLVRHPGASEAWEKIDRDRKARQ
jgi:hypothetical protein